MKHAYCSNTALALLATVLVFTIFCGSAWAKDLYVDGSNPGCSDSATYVDNDANNPWCTLLRATRGTTDGNRNSPANSSEAAQAGDTVHIAAGTYEYTGPSYSQGGFGGDCLYEPINSGTSGSWITFQAEGLVRLTGNTSGSATVIGSHGPEYIKWVGFTIDQSQIGYRGGNGVAAVYANNIWLDRLHLIGAFTDYGYDDNHTGIMVHGPLNNSPDGGFVCGQWPPGTGVEGFVGITISNSRIHGFTGTSGNNDTGITIYCLHEITIENNEIYNNANGIYGKRSSSGSPYRSHIRKNLIRDNAGNGINYLSWSDHDIYQNVIRDNAGACFRFGGDPSFTVIEPKPMDIYFVNNTCANNTQGINYKGVCGEFNNNFVQNNIFTNAVHGIISDPCGVPLSDISTNQTDFDNNVYEHSSSFSEFEFTAGTFSAWQANSQDANSSTSADCLYADEAANDFQLCTAAGAPVAGCSGASPCLEGGANDGVDILDLDHDGRTDDPITLGAYITGDEVIGLVSDTAAPRAPLNLVVE